MIQPDQLFQPSWQLFNVMVPLLIRVYTMTSAWMTLSMAMNSLHYSPQQRIPLNFNPLSSALLPGDFVQYPFCDDSQQVMLAMNDISMVCGELESILNDDDEIECMDGLLGESEGSFSIQQFSTGEDFLCPRPSTKSESSPDVSLLFNHY